MKPQKKDRKANKPKQYVCIVKVGNLPNGDAKCVKYRLNDLLKFCTFLDDKWPTWTWFNVYSNLGENKGEKLESFTKKNRPLRSKL